MTKVRNKRGVIKTGPTEMSKDVMNDFISTN